MNRRQVKILHPHPKKARGSKRKKHSIFISQFNFFYTFDGENLKIIKNLNLKIGQKDRVLCPNYVRRPNAFYCNSKIDDVIYLIGWH